MTVISIQHTGMLLAVPRYSGNQNGDKIRDDASHGPVRVLLTSAKNFVVEIWGMSSLGIHERDDLERSDVT